MRVLAVRQPWASLIAEGFKTIEVRSRYTHIRDDIAIYASRTKASQEDIAYINQVLSEDLGLAWEDPSSHPLPFPLPHGQILAVASLYDCSPVLSPSRFLQLRPRHRNPIENYVPGKTFNWMLGDVRKVEPVDFKFSGSIVWSKIDENLLKEVV